MIRRITRGPSNPRMRKGDLGAGISGGGAQVMFEGQSWQEHLQLSGVSFSQQYFRVSGSRGVIVPLSLFGPTLVG